MWKEGLRLPQRSRRDGRRRLYGQLQFQWDPQSTSVPTGGLDGIQNCVANCYRHCLVGPVKTRRDGQVVTVSHSRTHLTGWYALLDLRDKKKQSLWVDSTNMVCIQVKNETLRHGVPPCKIIWGRIHWPSGSTNRLYCLPSLNIKRRAWRYSKRSARSISTWLLSTWLHVFQKEFLNQRLEGRLGRLTMGLFPQAYDHCASSSRTRPTRSAFSSERVGSCTILAFSTFLQS